MFSNNKKEDGRIAKPISQGLDHSSLLADIEKLKSGMEANSELRQIYSEKFTRLDEQIGELRNMIFGSEKNISHISVLATKASDLVSEVHPENLLGEVKKADTKIETVKSKLESYHELNDTIMNELKNMKRTVKMFRGLENVRKMLSDAHKDLTSYEKIEDLVENHSDKIENVYTDFLNKFEEFQNFKFAKETFDKQIKHFNDLYKEFKEKNNIIKKEDFEKFSDKIYNFVKSIQNENHMIIYEFKKFKKKVVDENSKLKKELYNQFNSKFSMIEEIKSEFNPIKQKIDSFENVDIIKGFEEKFLKMEHLVEDTEHKIASLSDEFALNTQHSDTIVNDFIGRIKSQEKTIEDMKKNEKTLAKSMITLMRKFKEL